MPLFAWRGVDIEGTIHKGVIGAQSPDHVETLLLMRRIAVISCKPSKKRFLKMPVRTRHIIELLRQLAVLTSSGILLPEALRIIAQQTRHAYLQDSMYEIANGVHSGMSLSVAMQQYTSIFSPLVISLIKIAEESGTLSQACTILADYLDNDQQFYARLRSALLLPAITFSFFIGIALLIFIFIVPHFEVLFKSTAREMPAMTSMLFTLSHFVRSWYFVSIIVALIVGIVALKSFLTTERGQMYRDLLLTRIPGVRTVVKYRFLAHWLESVAMLLEGGMQLVPALYVVYQTSAYQVYRMQNLYVLQAVEMGVSLSDAMMYNPRLFDPEIIAMTRVGEESGKLSVMLIRVARWYQALVQKKLSLYTLFAQPLIMIILGLLISLLIIALYVPIFTLSNSLSI